MTVAGFEYKASEPIAPGECFDLGEDRSADPLPLMLRPGVHAFDLADAIRIAAERADSDRVAICAGNKQRRGAIRHLLDGHVRAELRAA